MFNVHESQRCKEDPRGSHVTLLANPHATLGPVTHKVPYCWKSCVLEHRQDRPECSLSQTPYFVLISHFHTLTCLYALGVPHSHCYSVGRSLQDRSLRTAIGSQAACSPIYHLTGHQTSTIQSEPPCPELLYSQFQLMAAQPHVRNGPNFTRNSRGHQQGH